MHFISNGVNGVNINSLWYSCKLMCNIFGKDTQPFDFIKPNKIQKLAYKVKYIGQINGGWSCFFQNFFFENFFKISWLNCEQYRKNQYKKKEHNQQSNVQSAMITFLLFKYHRSIDNSIDFLSFILSWKGSRCLENTKPHHESQIMTH